MLNYVLHVYISLLVNVSFDHPSYKTYLYILELSPYLYCMWIYKFFLLGGHGDIKTGSTYKLYWGNVELISSLYTMVSGTVPLD
jgi:hypothetical protein